MLVVFFVAGVTDTGFVLPCYRLVMLVENVFEKKGKAIQIMTRYLLFFRQFYFDHTVHKNFGYNETNSSFILFERKFY